MKFSDPLLASLLINVEIQKRGIMESLFLPEFLTDTSFLLLALPRFVADIRLLPENGGQKNLLEKSYV